MVDTIFQRLLRAHQEGPDRTLTLERPDSSLDYGLKVISQDIGAQLRMLKPLRELASYELGEVVRVDQAEQAVRAAKDILAECAKGLRKLNT